MEVIAQTLDPSGEDMLSGWEHSIFKEGERGTRRERLQLAMDRASDMLSDNLSWLVEQREWIRRLDAFLSGRPYDDSTSVKTDSESTTLKETHTRPSMSPDWHKVLFRKFCARGFQAVGEKLVALGQKYFFISLDDCAALGASMAGSVLPSPHITLVGMQRILKAADTLSSQVHFWFLLLDTNPKTYLRALPPLQTTSHRLTSPLLPLPPFVYLGFNQMAHEVTIKTAREALTIKHLQRLGRPVSLSCITLLSQY